MATFAEVIADVNTKFNALESGADVTFLVGERYLHEQRNVRDVVFVSPGGTFQPHAGAGPEVVGDDYVSPMLMDRVANFSCFVWGTDEDEAEDLMVQIIRAMDQELSWRNFTIADYDAVTEDEDEEKNGYVWRGFSYVMRGSLRLVMSRETIGTALVENQPDNTGTYS